MKAQKVYEVSSDDKRAELFLAVLQCLWRYNSAELYKIAKDAGVHWTTMWAWTSGRTTAPRIDTLTRVAEVLGFRIVLKRDAQLPKPQRGLRAVK